VPSDGEREVLGLVRAHVYAIDHVRVSLRVVERAGDQR